MSLWSWPRCTSNITAWCPNSCFWWLAIKPLICRSARSSSRCPKAPGCRSAGRDSPTRPSEWQSRVSKTPVCASWFSGTRSRPARNAAWWSDWSRPPAHFWPSKQTRWILDLCSNRCFAGRPQGSFASLAPTYGWSSPVRWEWNSHRTRCNLRSNSQVHSEVNCANGTAGNGSWSARPAKTSGNSPQGCYRSAAKKWPSRAQNMFFPRYGTPKAADASPCTRKRPA